MKALILPKQNINYPDAKSFLMIEKNRMKQPKFKTSGMADNVSKYGHRMQPKPKNNKQLKKTSITNCDNYFNLVSQRADAN